MKIDLHVHMVGNGVGGSGCWYHPRGITRLGEPIMIKSFGLPRRALRENLDEQYAQRLLELVRASSLDAAVILAQDEPYEANGRKIDRVASHYVPNDYVLRLAADHPEFLAGVSIHPARPDALEELDRCLAGGAALLKCLPNCQNIDWADRRYTRFLERMAEAGLPLLAHTGSEHTLPVIDQKLADPRVLLRPLEIGVTCIAAHCGTAGLPFEPDYFDVFVDLVRRFPRCYGDNSAFNLIFRRFSRRHLNLCQSDLLRGRILHGSDAPVPVMPFGPRLRGLITGEQRREARRIKNPIERDYQLKRMVGFPEESFTRAASLLRLLKQNDLENATKAV